MKKCVWAKKLVNTIITPLLNKIFFTELMICVICTCTVLGGKQMCVCYATVLTGLFQRAQLQGPKLTGKMSHIPEFMDQVMT